MLVRLFRGLAVAATGLSLTGCFFETDDHHGAVVVRPPPPGALTVEWLVLSSADPSGCARIGADRLELVIFDDFGHRVTEVDTPCEDMQVTVELDEGVYSADATLVDVADRSVTTTHTIDALDVVRDSELVVTVDFPADSVL